MFSAYVIIHNVSNMGKKAKMGKCRLLASELNIYALSVLIYSQGAPFSGRKAAKVVTTLRPTLRLKPDSSPARNNYRYIFPKTLPYKL